MKISVISFTEKGDGLNKKIANSLTEGEIMVSLKSERKIPLTEWTQSSFSEADALIYIGAAGIAVRAIAPFIKTKDKDPAVLVIDEKGQFVIPVLSGHIGGANELAEKIAASIGATAVITTATDINQVWAVDNWAKKKGYEITPIGQIKNISGSLLAGKPVGMTSPLFQNLEEVFGVAMILENIRWNDLELENGICISPYRERPFTNTLQLIPKCIVIGVGSRKDADEAALCSLADLLLEEHGICKESVECVATIDIKKDERSVLALGKYLNVPVKIYTAEELNGITGEFEASEFVRQITGTDNVCERSAAAASDGGTVLVKKTKGNGVTAAIALRSLR